MTENDRQLISLLERLRDNGHLFTIKSTPDQIRIAIRIGLNNGFIEEFAKNNYKITQPGLDYLRDKDLISPLTEIISSNTPQYKSKKSLLEVVSWICGIIVTIITIYEFLHIHFGWFL